MEDDDLIIADPNQMQFTKEGEGFSHEALVMSAYRSAQQSLQKEMRKGYNSIEHDKSGKAIIVYHEDTRLCAIESIKTLKNVLVNDIEGTDYAKKIKELIDKIKNKEQSYIELQLKYWESLRDRLPRKAIGVLSSSSLNESVIFGILDKESVYYDKLVEESLDIYREVFEQLELALAKNNYLKRAVFENLAGDDDDGTEIG